jgi:uncharacterized membrane protein
MSTAPDVATPWHRLLAPPTTSWPRTIARLLLGAALLLAGTGHLTFQRLEFAAQVPRWLPLDADFVVVASGVVELLLGASLVLLGRWRVLVGVVVAAFFVAIFPGNINQYVHGISAFGLDTDRARFVRLFFQPLLVLWALWSTGAWRALRAQT